MSRNIILSNLRDLQNLRAKPIHPSYFFIQLRLVTYAGQMRKPLDSQGKECQGFRLLLALELDFL
jgi:hypothetical protein